MKRLLKLVIFSMFLSTYPMISCMAQTPCKNSKVNALMSCLENECVQVKSWEAECKSEGISEESELQGCVAKKVIDLCTERVKVK